MYFFRFFIVLWSKYEIVNRIKFILCWIIFIWLLRINWGFNNLMYNVLIGIIFLNSLLIEWKLITFKFCNNILFWNLLSRYFMLHTLIFFFLKKCKCLRFHLVVNSFGWSCRCNLLKILDDDYFKIRRIFLHCQSCEILIFLIRNTSQCDSKHLKDFF